MEKLRWGIISTALIGTEKVIPALQRGKHCEVTGIASRDVDKAQSVADRLQIPKFYGSYEELLCDSEIDAVYNPLPNHLHVPVSIQALQAGKHVLCEKPIGLTSQQGQQLVDVARQYPELKVMEAFMYRFHPQWQRARQLVVDGRIGQLQTIQSFFSYYNVDPNNIRNQLDAGGGGLMDIGCYPVSLSRLLFDDEPQRVLGIVDYDETFKTDRHASAILDFEQGTATMTCSTQLAPYQRVNICGDRGRIEIEIPFNAPTDQPCRLWHQTSTSVEEIVFEVCNQYTLQGDQFALAALNNTEVPTPIEDAVRNMEVIEAIIRSGKTDRWQRIRRHESGENPTR